MNLRELEKEIESVSNNYGGLVQEMRQMQDGWEWIEVTKELQRMDSALGTYVKKPQPEIIRLPREKETYWRPIRTVLDDDGNVDYQLTREENRSLF